MPEAMRSPGPEQRKQQGPAVRGMDTWTVCGTGRRAGGWRRACRAKMGKQKSPKVEGEEERSTYQGEPCWPG